MDPIQLLYQLYTSLELSLIYGLVAMGVYLSFRVLDFPDLTVDGSFVLGAAVASTLILLGVNPWLASMLSMLAGAMAGIVTAWLNVRWNILHLLASILTMMGLYSVNLRIMGRPNLPLYSEATVFTPFISLFGSRANGVIVLLTIMVLIVSALVFRFLSSEIGLAMRATGKNPQMARAQGIRTQHMILAGMALSNSLVALAGAFFAQSMGFADITLGLGTILVGIAAVIIGEVVPTRSIFNALVLCVFGSVIYHGLRAGALHLELINSSDQQLFSAVLVGLAMILPNLIRDTLRRRRTV
ncbi:MAG: ABC transporter permease [Pseudomonadota bacterium]